MSTMKRQPGESLADFLARYERSKRTTETLPIAGPAPVDPVVSGMDDLVPEVEETTRSKENLEIDEVLGRIDIVDAYNRWCGKMHADSKGRRESIMVSCPFPGHEDRNPSAWLSLDKGDGGVGNCAMCGGFDKYDLAAWRFGFPVPGYKSKVDFPELRRAMAEDLGYRVMTAGKDEWLEPVSDVAPASPTPTPTEPVATDAPDVSSTISSSPPPPIVEVVDAMPSLDWRELPSLADGSFLRTWMEITSESYEPEEFYLFEGLLALGCAVGNKVKLADAIPVRPNLMVCVVGSTGAGKSLAISALTRLLHEALPFDRDLGSGVKQIGSVGSGEALLDEFNHVVEETDTGAKIALPIVGLLEENEMAAFTKRAARNGSTIREVLMSLYDRDLPVRIKSRGAGEVVASDHFMQMVTSTQPGSLRRLLTDADATAGFLNRWVFPFGAHKDRPALTTFRLDVGPAVDELRVIRSWASASRTVDWHDEAAANAYIEFFEANIRPLKRITLGEEENNLLSRIDLLVKKLILLFAINDRSTTVTVEHVQSVARMYPYLVQTYGIVKDEVGVTDFEAVCEAILAYMMGRTEPVTIREIKYNSAARKFDTKIVTEAVEILTRGSFLEEVPRAKSDRTRKFQIAVDAETPVLSIVR